MLKHRLMASKPFPEISHSKCYLLLAFISLALLSHSLWQIKPLTVDPGELLGVVAHLAPSFWVGLGLIICCCIFAYRDENIKSDSVFLIIAIILGLFLLSIGVVGEITLQHYPAGEVKTILATNHIDIRSPHPALSYRMWPAIHFISASLVHTTGTEIGALVKYIPLLWVVGFTLILFTLGKRLGFSSNQAFMLSCLGLASMWPYSGPSYQPVWLVLMPYFLLFMLLTSPKETVGEKIMKMLVSLMLVLTHGFTAMAAVLTASTFWIYLMIRKKQTETLVAFFLVTFAAWHLYMATPIFEFGTLTFVNAITTLNFGHLLGAQLVGGEPLPPRLQFMSFTLIFGGAILLVAFILPVASYLTGKVRKEMRRNVETCFFWLLGLIPLLVFEYGFEISFRIYLLAFVPILCMLISTVSKRKILIIFFVLLTLVNILAVNNSESPGFLTLTTELKGTEFFALRIEPQEPFLYRSRDLVWYHNPDLINVYSTTFWHKIDPAIFDRVTYIIDSRQHHSYLMLRFGWDPVREWLQKNEDRTERLYSNGFFNIYRRR